MPSATILAPPADRVLAAALERGAERWPQRPLIRSADGDLSYEQVRSRVAAAAGRLRAAGVERGDRVAIISGNRLELLEAWLGCGWTGAVAVPVNTAARGPGLAHVLSNAAPRLLIAESRSLEHVDRLEQPLPSLQQVWAMNGEDGAPPAAIAPGGTSVAVESLPVAAEPVAAADLGPGDPWTILYTSGTTGPAKGVICPQGQLWSFGAITAACLGAEQGDVLHTTLPMFHVNALNTFVQALLVGGVFSFGDRFSASGFWEEVRRREATVTYLLGAMVHILLSRDPDSRDRDHRLRVALSPATGAEQVEAFRQRFGVELIEGYGSTETNMVMCNWRDGELRAGTMGWPTEGFEAIVVDELDRELPAGVAGELIVRHREPFSIASGYFGMPEKTVEAWRNLWFHTGDRVVREADGSFRFIDRMKDAIRRRGENVSSFEVEQVLNLHPGVESCAVVPVPSELGEDEVMAFVVPAAGSGVSEADLIRHCEPRLAYFAIPRFLELVEAMPLTENGKIRKVELRERGAGAATWDRESAPDAPPIRRPR